MLEKKTFNPKEFMTEEQKKELEEEKNKNNPHWKKDQEEQIDSIPTDYV